MITATKVKTGVAQRRKASRSRRAPPPGGGVVVVGVGGKGEKTRVVFLGPASVGGTKSARARQAAKTMTDESPSAATQEQTRARTHARTHTRTGSEFVEVRGCI